jgi:isocitrate/isopropylmalate dehydrogenase
MRICVLPGDGIGPEVTNAALHVLALASSRFGFAVDLDERPFGGAAIDETGMPFPDATREACLGADAVLLGAVGGPRWNDAKVRPEQGCSRCAPCSAATPTCARRSATRGIRRARCARSSWPSSTS